MPQYVNIMTDRGFKAVFQDREITLSFLNAVLAGERQVSDITFIDKEIKPELMDNRTVIFDLLCEEPNGGKFILELQNCPQSYFFNRGFYYLCRMVTRQGETGDRWKYVLYPVYGIYLLNFTLPDFTEYRTDIILANEKTGKGFNPVRMKQIYISFPLFDLNEKQCETDFQRWIFILKNMSIFDQSPFKEEQEAFLRLLNVANLNALTEEERAAYEENLKNYRDWYNTIEYAAQDGEKKGRTETLRQSVQRMISRKMNTKDIAECLGISEEEIQTYME